jgi:uncharacterized protein YndB with AHSA1/START domain
MTTDRTTGSRHGSAVITLQADTDIVITRLFDASAESIFGALTTPDLVKRWWGFETGEWLVCDIDLRVGGRWRFVVREHGMEVGFNGEYRVIERPRRVVQTELFEGFPGGPPADPADAALTTLTLDEADGVTMMTVLVQHARPEHRDAHIGSGMEDGLQVSYDRLEDLVRGP